MDIKAEEYVRTNRGYFVNGYRILEITDLKNSNKKVFTICKSDFKNICRVWEEQDIQTILTKEQYMQNCYKLNTKQQI